MGVLPCPLGKNSYLRHFKGKQGKLYIIGKVNKCRFRKKMNCRFFNSTEESCNNGHENDHALFTQTSELIGYQNSVDFCEIWPEHSLDIMKPKCVGDS